MALIIDSIENVKAFVGKEVGVSDWYLIDQERINKFAEATDDFQWLHVDIERAKKELDVGSTIAHGYLLTALFPVLSEKTIIFNGERVINCGLNKVRFKQMVPVDSRVRLRSTLKSARFRAGALQVILVNVMEVEGQTKPACIAETIAFYFM
jgi:acyl dehydratase